jgi:hypothetical protein
MVGSGSYYATSEWIGEHFGVKNRWYVGAMKVPRSGEVEASTL